MARKSRKNVDTEQLVVSQTIYNVGAYVRLSAIDRKKKGDSIETQQAIISAYIAERPNLELTETYIDNGLSGQTTDRPAFQRMLGDLETGKINCCVTKDLSRLGRNSIDTGFYIEKYFPTHGIRYIAITDNYDSADGNSGGIMVSLKNLVNEAYALDIGRKFRATKQMNIRNGCFVGRFPPYGYLKSAEDKHKLVTDPYAAPIVLQVFEMIANGGKVTDVLNWLNESGIMPPRRYFFSIGIATEKEAQGNILWNKGAIYDIFKKRIYTGDMVQGKYRTVEHVQEVLPASEWVVTENTHEPIVSQTLFDKVNAIISNPDNQCIQESYEPKTANIFLRKIFCGHCGYALRRSRSGSQHGFRCETRTYYSKDACVPVSINEAALRAHILNMLQSKAEVYAGKMPLSCLSVDDGVNNEIRSTQAELDRKKHFLKGLYESLIDGDITKDDYREMKSSYESSIALLSDKVCQLRESARSQVLEVAKQDKDADTLQTVRGITTLTAEVLDKLVDRILVFEDKHIEAKLTFTDEIMVAGGADNE